MTVVFDLVGVQNRDHGERGIARYVLNTALEVERLAPGLVDHWLLRGDMPVPGTLEPLLSTGRARLLTRDRSWLVKSKELEKKFDTAAGNVALSPTGRWC